MGAITLAQAQAKLTLWMDAEDKVASNQAYSIEGRTWTRADLEEIGKRIAYWERRVARLSRGTGGGIRVRGGTPVG